jgi:hypothetical protein
VSPGRIRFGALIADPALRTGAKGACDGTFSFDSHVIACNTRRGLYAALATLEIGSFTDANTGTAVGQGGTILRTTDGGASWVAQESGTMEYLQGVLFTDANTGTVVGSAGTILRTTNGGGG